MEAMLMVNWDDWKEKRKATVIGRAAEHGSTPLCVSSFRWQKAWAAGTSKWLPRRLSARVALVQWDPPARERISLNFIQAHHEHHHPHKRVRERVPSELLSPILFEVLSIL